MKYSLFHNLCFKQVDEDFFGVYHPFNNHQIIFLPRKIVSCLENFKEAGELSSLPFPWDNLLVENRIILPEDYNQEIPLKNIAQSISSQPHFGLMYLILTEECNMRCEYCFVEGNLQHPPTFMSKETCERAIDLFTAMADKEGGKRVRFYGGEPLLNLEVFSWAVKKLREEETIRKLTPLEIAVATNGILVTPAIASFCRDYNLQVSVSIDGPEDIHNKVRKSIGGKGTYKETVRGYHLLKLAGCQPAISCTVTKENASKLEQVVDFFLRELNPTGVGFNYLLDFRSRKNPCDLPMEDAVKGVLAAFEILRENGIYEDRVMRRLSKVIDGQIHLKDCAGYGHQIVVTPQGKIGPCHVFLSMDQYIAGSVYDDKLSLGDNPIFQEFNQRSPLNIKECRQCYAVSLCGGGCAADAFIRKGTIWDKDERACIQCREFIHWMIDDLWKRRRKDDSPNNI